MNGLFILVFFTYISLRRETDSSKFIFALDFTIKPSAVLVFRGSGYRHHLWPLFHYASAARVFEWPQRPLGRRSHESRISWPNLRAEKGKHWMSCLEGLEGREDGSFPFRFDHSDVAGSSQTISVRRCVTLCRVFYAFLYFCLSYHNASPFPSLLPEFPFAWYRTPAKAIGSSIFTGKTFFCKGCFDRRLQ